MKFASFVASLSLLTVASGAVADEPSIGETLYNQNCAVCHGSQAKGAGELADLLTVEVPSLTSLSTENDGKFPMLEVIHIIDGRTGVRGHGGPMPMFGHVFTAEAEGDTYNYNSVIEARGKMMELALYLESIQQ